MGLLSEILNSFIKYLEDVQDRQESMSEEMKGKSEAELRKIYSSNGGSGARSTGTRCATISELRRREDEMRKEAEREMKYKSYSQLRDIAKSSTSDTKSAIRRNAAIEELRSRGYI